MDRQGVLLPLWRPSYGTSLSLLPYSSALKYDESRILPEKASRACRALYVQTFPYPSSRIQRLGRENTALIKFKVFESDTRAFCHTLLRVIGDKGWNARSFREETIEVAELGRTSREHHSLLHDIGREFRRCRAQHILDGIDDALK